MPPLGIRQDWLEEFDEVGAFQPIAFVAGGEPPGVTDRTPYEPNMAFREEQPYAPWSAYEWEAWGHPQITALYAPWQVLYIDDVLERCNGSPSTKRPGIFDRGPHDSAQTTTEPDCEASRVMGDPERSVDATDEAPGASAEPLSA